MTPQFISLLNDIIRWIIFLNIKRECQYLLIQALYIWKLIWFLPSETDTNTGRWLSDISSFFYCNLSEYCLKCFCESLEFATLTFKLAIVATSHIRLLNNWNVISPNWDVLYILYALQIPKGKKCNVKYLTIFNWLHVEILTLDILG